MLWVHIRLNFEYERCERGFGGFNASNSGRARLRRWRPFSKGPKNLADAKVVDPGTKEHGCLTPSQKRLELEGPAGGPNQFDIVA